jgi:methyltransferase (TIGR00027 family)
MMVAFGRGLGTEGAAPDPIAKKLLPRPVGTALRWLGELDARGAPARLLVRAASLGMVDHVSLRTAAIDAAVGEAVSAGARQLVILGAGLDARAWRLPCLAGLDAFELDHPDTQRAKRESVESVGPALARVHFVAIDFEHERVGERLADAGHDAARSTVWIWEGVTPYLPLEAIDTSLVDVGARSASGSVLCMTYAVPDIFVVPVPGLRAITRVAFQGLGEPLRGAMTPHEAAEHVATVGFDAVHDSDAREWASFAPGSPKLALPFRGERLLVAKRR